MDRFQPSPKVREIRERLDHPVIDSDGHLVELRPVAMEYIAKAGGADMARRFAEEQRSTFLSRDWYGLPPAERLPFQDGDCDCEPDAAGGMLEGIVPGHRPVPRLGGQLLRRPDIDRVRGAMPPCRLRTVRHDPHLSRETPRVAGKMIDTCGPSRAPSGSNRGGHLCYAAARRPQHRPTPRGAAAPCCANP